MSKLLDDLRQFNSDDEESDSYQKDSSQFSDPFSTSINPLAMDSFVRKNKEEKKKSKEKAPEGKFSDLFEFDDMESDDSELDFSMEHLFDYTEDENLRNNLVKMGRKYARDHAFTEDQSEIAKAFAGQETALQNLIAEIDKDAAGVQQDINTMRMSRSRNFKALSDLVSARGSLHSTKLSAIKEVTSLRKNIVDLTMKSKAKEAGDDASSNAATFAIQKLLSGANREAILDSVGGRGDTITNESLDDSPYFEMEPSDEIIQKKYFSDDYEDIEDPKERARKQEGSKYIQYENDGVQLYLNVSESGHQTVIAKNKYGEVVPDYPLPTNADSLEFSVHEDLGTATDQMHRSYILDKD